MGRIATWNNSGIHRDIGVLPMLQAAQSDPQPTSYWTEKDNWQIDHIKPLDPTKEITDKAFLKRLHYKNLQPLTLTENHSKSNMEVDELEKLFKETEKERLEEIAALEEKIREHINDKD